jgi:hypothetical protein
VSAAPGNCIFYWKILSPGGPEKDRAPNNFCRRPGFHSTGAGIAPRRIAPTLGRAADCAREEGESEVQNGPAERSARRTGQHREGRARGWGRPSHCFLLLLFRDGAAGDTIARIARRVRLHIIGLRVNYQRGAAIAEHRMIVAAQGDVLVRHVGLGRSI